jgi:dihydroorotase
MLRSIFIHIILIFLLQASTPFISFCFSVSIDSSYDLLIKGSRVYDPRSGMKGKYDVAIRGNKIVRISKKLDPASSRKVISVKNAWIVPGLIDIHTHVFAGSQSGKFADGTSSVNPDIYCPMNGITTVVDAGTAGWRNFMDFKKQVIQNSRTRVLAFLNIAGAGMAGKPMEEDTADMRWQPVQSLLATESEYIVGFKVGHYTGEGNHPMEAARTMGDFAKLPVFVECHLPKIPLNTQLSFLKAGDIMTHCFEQVAEREPFMQRDGNVLPTVLDAKERGVLFDLGHGGAGFWFDQGIPAIQQGFLPHTLGTDLHRNSISASMKSMPNVMSKFLAMGVSFYDVITRCTWNAAQAIRRTDLGQIKEEGIADLTLLRLERGTFGFSDAGGKRIIGKRRIAVELTVRDGKIIWDQQGRMAEAWHLN